MCSFARTMVRIMSLATLGLVPLTPIIYQGCMNIGPNWIGTQMVQRDSAGKTLYEFTEYSSLNVACVLLAIYFVICSISMFVFSFQECK